LEHLSFSILFKPEDPSDDEGKDSLDLVANSEQEFDTWTSVLPVLMERDKRSPYRNVPPEAKEVVPAKSKMELP